MLDLQFGSFRGRDGPEAADLFPPPGCAWIGPMLTDSG
jgi:hypothetical protein